MLRMLFHEPCIPGNTGNAIRLAAATGTELHLVEPLGFQMSDAHLRRAGLDYHELAHVHVHADLTHAWQQLMPARVIAFTTKASDHYTEIVYNQHDVLMFGCEPTGLPDDVVADPHITRQVRIPMLAGRRSLNLANCAAIAVYEAWRQFAFEAGT